MTTQKKEIFLQDYTKPPYLVDEVHLHVELDPQQTRVRSRLMVRPDSSDNQSLQLNGEQMTLEQVMLQGKVLDSTAYTFENGILTLPEVPQEPFTVEITNTINPAANTALEGLYRSSDNYCTQCEAEGFRRITCFPDRPDVMSVFTTTIVADKRECPVLLSNGNLIDSGTMEDGRHYATWNDPYKKPCYLFALVAGDLVCIEDSYTTASGRQVALRIYVEDRNRDKCAHAMQSLKKAMQWDEEVFGREYDLDTYMIVAVDDFNMGAMENKGLNIFNSKYVLATPESATDIDFDGIEGVIAHEYFHNWTGNRITCRDWFQLSLKEGLTVFRDQEFSADMGSRAVQRIQDVNIIRSLQFKEDSGPMAHPVRPPSFVEINNFYTLTVYNKGAEVIRMLHTLLGRSGFRKGMDLYFTRHDGQAVTCDDFVQAMADANDVDFSRFKRWYSQAGTPQLHVDTTYAADTGTFTVRVRQSCPPTPETKKKQPFFLPLAMGLLDSKGQAMIPRLRSGEQADASGTVVLTLAEEEQEFLFEGIQEQPVLSFLRNFSAPVLVDYPRTASELAFLMACDTDPFQRWDAAQQFGLTCILEQLRNYGDGKAIVVDDALIEGMRSLINDSAGDPALLAMALVLPSENWIGQQLEVVDPVAIFTVRDTFRRQIADALAEEFGTRYLTLQSSEPYAFTPQQIGKRALKNCCLGYLLAVEGGAHLQTGMEQYRKADNMTDRIAALQNVVNSDHDHGQALLTDFYDQWHQDPLVMDKWLTLQAACILPGTLDRVQGLMNHQVFSLKNPNKVRSLIGAFSSLNQAQFHAEDGSGYTFLGEVLLELDRLNPMIAARLAAPFTQWRRYGQRRQELIRAQLERLAHSPDLSGDLGEIVKRSLQVAAT